MQEKYNVTGVTCAACQARVQKSVSNLTGVQECNVNLLKNSMVVTYDDKNVNSEQIIAAVEKAGYYSRSRENRLHRPYPRWKRQKRNMRRCAVE